MNKKVLICRVLNGSVQYGRKDGQRLVANVGDKITSEQIEEGSLRRLIERNVVEFIEDKVIDVEDVTSRPAGRKNAQVSKPKPDVPDDNASELPAWAQGQQ